MAEAECDETSEEEELYPALPDPGPLPLQARPLDPGTVQLSQQDQPAEESLADKLGRQWHWHHRFPNTELYTLRWESQMLQTLGNSVYELAWSTGVGTVRDIAMYTTLSALVAALAWPYYAVKALDVLDPTWTLACERADLAGKVLAETLLERKHGNRPVTLIGFSMGARVIFSCLVELANRHRSFLDSDDQTTDAPAPIATTEAASSEEDALPSTPRLQRSNSSAAQSSPVGGLVENVVLMGTPVSCSAEWAKAAEVVPGRLVNCYSSTDWTLGLLYRSQRWSTTVAGIRETNCPGVENVDVSAVVKRHTDYSVKVPDILDLIKLADDHHAPAPVAHAAVLPAAEPV